MPTRAVACTLQDEKNDRIKRWKEWLLEDANKGSRHAHTYSRLPNAWKPNEAETKDGALRRLGVAAWW